MFDPIASHTLLTGSRQLSLCHSNDLQEAGKWNVLLVEPARNTRSERELLLSEANCCVTNVRDVREMFHLHFEKTVLLAVLNDLLGPFSLRAAAESVRRQWPLAKILIVGSAVPALEDHLYDDVIRHRHDEKELLDVLQSLTENSWSQRMMGQARPLAAAQESDPAKALPPPSDSKAPRTLPNGIYRLRAIA